MKQADTDLYNAPNTIQPVAQNLTCYKREMG